MSQINLPFPAPPDLTEASFFLFVFVGYVTRAFTKNLDQDVQKTQWFLKQGKNRKLAVKKLLDVFHHWPLGWALMVWAAQVAAWVPGLSLGDVYWIGAAIFLDDLPDIPRRVRGAFSNYSVFGQLTDAAEP